MTVAMTVTMSSPLWMIGAAMGGARRRGRIGHAISPHPRPLGVIKLKQR